MHAPDARLTGASGGDEKEHTIAGLLQLISLHRLSERNFRRAARRVPNPYYIKLFRRLARQRAQFASALIYAIQRHAGSTTAPSERQPTLKFDRSMSSHQIFSHCVRLERELLKLLRSSYHQTLPSEIQELLAEHQRILNADIERLSALRDASR